VEILVPKVPLMVEIGGISVEDWCQIGGKTARQTPTFSEPVPCFPFPGKEGVTE